MSDECRDAVRDAWLAEILGRDVYRVVVRDGIVPRETVRALQAGRVFLYARIPTTCLRAVADLESLGFRLIDTNVTFTRPIPSGVPAHATWRVRAAVPGDREAVTALGRAAFAYSRFHLDPAVPRPIADEIKARWAAAWFAGARGHAMVVAESEKRIVGFCLLLHGSDGTATVDLIAVDAAYRGRGIAGAMIARAEALSMPFPEIRVGTQVANLASMRCYERLGFRIASSQYVFHYHNPSEYRE